MILAESENELKHRLTVRYHNFSEVSQSLYMLEVPQVLELQKNLCYYQKLVVYLKKVNLQCFVVPTSIGIATAISNYDKGGPKEGMRITCDYLPGSFVYKTWAINQFKHGFTQCSGTRKLFIFLLVSE